MFHIFILLVFIVILFNWLNGTLMRIYDTVLRLSVKKISVV